MSNPEHDQQSTFAKRMMWFVVLYLVGFGGTLLLVMPFHFLVKAAMHH